MFVLFECYLYLHYEVGADYERFHPIELFILLMF